MNINLNTYMIEAAPTYEEGARYLKTIYGDNKQRYEARFESLLDTFLLMHEVPNRIDIINFYSDLFNEVTAYSYKEAFNIKDADFRNAVFSIINVPEMIKNLGSERIKTDGIKLKNKVYNTITKEFEIQDFTQIYELHKVNGEDLGLQDEDLYAIKCWCTSTAQEHWLWVDSDTGKSEDPLTAIASTCKVYKSMLGNIKHIIRQGDVFLFEMLNDTIIPQEDEEIIPLDKDTYFKLLISQS